MSLVLHILWLESYYSISHSKVDVIYILYLDLKDKHQSQGLYLTLHCL